MGGVKNDIKKGFAGSPDLQAVTDVGNSITDGTDTNTVSAGSVVITDGSTSAYYGREFIELTDGVNGITVDPSSINVNGTIYLNDKITIGAVNYPLPTGASSQIATLADLPQIANNFLDDTAAAVGGIPIGGLYHTSGVVKIRLT